MRHLLLAIALVGCGGGSPPPAAPTTEPSAATYEVHLGRVTRPGDSVRLDLSAEEHKERVIARAGAPEAIEREDMEVHLVGTQIADEVDARGRSMRSRFIVDSFTVSAGGLSGAPLAQGAVITFTAPESPERGAFEVQGQVLSELVIHALELVLNTSRSASTDDEVFRTAGQRRVGETWQVDVARMNQDLSAHAPGLTVDDGSFTLVDTAEEDGLAMLRVAAEIHGRGVMDAPTPAGPARLTGEMRTVFDGLVPVDPDLQRGYHTHEMTLAMSGALPGIDPPTTIRISVRTRKTARAIR